MARTRKVDIPGNSFRYGAASFVGVHPQTVKRNQDAWVAVESFMCDPGMCLLGVFDGHGASGGDVSNFLVGALPVALAEALERAASRSQAWAQAFQSCQTELKRHPRINANMSGSTAVVVLVDGPDLTVANLGDSRCILGGAGGAQALSRDHTPEVPEERERVLQMGGEVRPLVFRGQGFGPPRVWVHGSNRPGLCMTRSFGDVVAHVVGVTHLPELQRVTLRQGDRFLVLCSDGISQFMADDRIMEIVERAADQGGEPHEVASHLCAVAAGEWRKYDSTIDDCTAIVVFLDGPGAGPAAAAADAAPAAPPREARASGSRASSRGARDLFADRDVAAPEPAGRRTQSAVVEAASPAPPGPLSGGGSSDFPGLVPLPSSLGEGAKKSSFSMKKLSDALSIRGGALGRMFRRRATMAGQPGLEDNPASASEADMRGAGGRRGLLSAFGRRAAGPGGKPK